MATIYEVADVAGVSVKTVSRVINNSENVADKTRSRVLDAMDKLDFAPSAIARQMRLGKASAIGMLYGDPGSEYQAQLNHSILRACVNVRRYLSVELFEEQTKPWVDQVAAFLDRSQVGAMILVPPLCDSIEVHALLLDRGIDFSLISPSRPVCGASAVAMDDRLAAREITEHLISLGHTKMAHIAGDEGHVAALSRRRGFLEAIDHAPANVERDPIIVSGRFQFKVALEAAEELLSSPERPSAIFAANDHMALAAIMAAHRRGVRIPEDLSVAGFDNTPMGQSIWPTLTTVAQPFDEIARKAIQILDYDRAQTEDVAAAHILPHKLVIRASTGPAPQTAPLHL